MILTETKIDRAEVAARLPHLTALIEQHPTPFYNVARGELGKVLYYFYLSRVQSDPRLAVQGNNLLSDILLKVTASKAPELMNPTLANGLAGLGLTLEVLINEGFIEDVYNDFLCRIDNYVFEGALKRLKSGDTDFLHGATGGFHYLSYRVERNPAVRDFLSEYVECLLSISVKAGDASYLPNNFMAAIAAPGSVNLGLSHGMASSVLVLVNILEQGIQVPLISYLLNQFVPFFLKYQHPDPEADKRLSRFPNSVFLNEEPSGARNQEEYRGGLRWCYGDMNMAHLLYKASAILDNPTWQHVAEETGLATLAKTDIITARCHGSFFCHGATGIAHYYDYLHRISGHPAYQRGFRHWMQIAFDLFEKEKTDRPYPEYTGYLLEGSVGSGLVLMASQEQESAYWEKIWLLS